MATQEKVERIALRLRIEDGETASGAPRYKDVNFSSINPEVSAENLYKAAEQLGGLLEKAPAVVEKVATIRLSNEG